MKNYCLLVMTVLFVHMIKAARLYLALYGTDVSRKNFLETYCLTTPFSILIPFKLGELLRMYSYGNLIGDHLKGVVIILLDRFMDTLALMSILIGGIRFYRSEVSLLVWLFACFLFIILLLYLIFPGAAGYWKKYLLTARATPGKIRLLESLEISIHVFKEAKEICKGKGTLLYAMSLLAWGTEIGGIILQSNGKSDAPPLVNRYLTAAIGGGSSVELQRFVVVSVILLLIAWIALKISYIIKKRKPSNENVAAQTG